MLARPPSASYRCFKLIRRNPVVTTLAALLFLGLVAALIVGTVLTLGLARAKRESDGANRRLSENLVPGPRTRAGDKRRVAVCGADELVEREKFWFIADHERIPDRFLPLPDLWRAH